MVFFLVWMGREGYEQVKDREERKKEKREMSTTCSALPAPLDRLWRAHASAGH